MKIWNRCHLGLCLIVALTRNVGAAEKDSPPSPSTNVPPATLEALVADVVEHNPKLNFYRAEIAAAKGERRTAATWANPEVATTLGQKSVRGGGLSQEGVAWSVSVQQTIEWTRNEFVIIGPHSDSAGIRGLKDGAAALARIAQAQAPFIDFQNSGARDLTAKLWQKTRIQPQGAWLLADESESSEEALASARRKQAYLVLGRIPVVPGVFSEGGMEILVQGDPDMHRPFVVMEASLKKFPDTNAKGAHALANFFLSAKTQKFLLEFGTNSLGGMPLFYPMRRN